LSSGDPINPGETLFGRALYAALLSGACNIPLTKLVGPGLTIDLLETAKEEIVCPQTLQAAMIALVNFYSQLPLAQCWGEGSTSSSDGQGFMAEGRPVGARYNRHRFPGARGFILYTHVSDNYAPFYVQVFPANVREASFVLDGLLYHGTILVPREVYTDSHGFTDVVFAFLWLLGFKLAPRIANLPNSTLWYGKGFEPDQKDIFKGSISMKHIVSQWEPIQRIMGTILEGRIPASQLIQKISAFSRKHGLYKGYRHMGRIVRTRHILDMAVDPDYCRDILQGLNKGESRNYLAKELRYARQGTFREGDPELRLSAASCLNLVILCIAISNTVQMQKTIRQLIKRGMKITKKDARYLSPYLFGHLNFYGQFNFLPVPVFDSLFVEKEILPLEGLF